MIVSCLKLPYLYFMTHSHFLPGVPEGHILKRLQLAGGNEIESGKLASPQSSASLAINTFGRFCLEPEKLPALPRLQHLDWPAQKVEIEYSARFPWSGGRHPWLDALVQTQDFHIGIECKRFEPYRDKKTVSLSDAYWREVWGTKMQPFLDVRDELQNGDLKYNFLDATQLLKHAFGLRTDFSKRHVGKPILAYVYIETIHDSPVRVTSKAIEAHKAEIADFARRVEGAEVGFISFSYEEWLQSFPAERRDFVNLIAETYHLTI